ncbi:serine/threonine-protein phosphatase 6 regulatory ankyrin repeat subunit B-like [Mytilus californianus]|uniref:serine/threonine-protein phosphatase 6 regulatory ankyrin repeat subunit B-like n=1 Tax=Mytilus californianus TaxID=6549 RepID=UPI002248427B|nr:serine/threonine-protein phosphatase 6 regulatory ankyrin repeat subunit B-like [Mytilus californianus]
MKYCVSLLILNCLILQVSGVLEWTVVRKVTDYGQNVTLFCNVSNCCPKYSGWDMWTPEQRTLFIDVKTAHPNKKYDGKATKDGYTLVIKNLTKQDLNVSYSCLYGVTFGERKFLLEEDVFTYISTEKPNVPTSNRRLSEAEIAALITGVIVAVSVSGILSIYFWSRKKNRKSKSDTDENFSLIEEEQGEIQRNIAEQINNEIEDWKRKDNMFVPTRASDTVMECLQNNSCVTLTGPSGVGKSFICRHTALVLQKIGYRIITIYSPMEIRTYYHPGVHTVFIIDDICGNFAANKQQIENWKPLLPVINTIIADKCCKIIVSCRLQVYKDHRFEILLPFKSCECNLISDKLCLTIDEKNDIANTYIGTSAKDIDPLSRKSEFFPLLCSLCHEQKISDANLFFRNPFFVYENELDNLSKSGTEGNYKLCSLSLCVIFNNQLKEDWFEGKVTDEQQHMINDISESFAVKSLPKKLLWKVLDTLIGTFIYKQNGVYRTMHDKLFDFLAQYFGQKMIKCLIEHGDSDLVHERFIWQTSRNEKNNNTDFMIEIQDTHLKSYLSRFIKDWSEGKVTDVFSNTNIKVLSFRKELLQYLQKLDKSIQVTLTNTKDTEVPKECGTGNTPLIMVCCDGYTDLVQWMILNDVDVDQCRNDRSTALNLACGKGYTSIVEMLLERNPHVDLCDNDECSPLSMASREGHYNIVRLLLEKNPNIDIRSIFGRTALNNACYKGYTTIVEMLLKKKPDVDLCDNNGSSPLLIASQEGHTDIVRLLLENYSNVDICDNDGSSPLYMASQNGYTDIVFLLLKTNPNVNIRVCSKYGFTALALASYKGYTSIVNMLLERNPNVDLCDNNGCSPLLMASWEGHIDIVRSLLQKNANVDLCNKKYCYTPLYTASQKGFTDIVRLLLEKNPDVNLCDNNGLTPLQTACYKGYTEIVKMLLEKKTIIYQSNKEYGCSALYIAVTNGYTDIVRLLLEKNHDVNLYNKNVFKALTNACCKGYTTIVEMLLKKIPRPDLSDNNGYSPLLMASQEGHSDIVRLLLEKNGDVDLCDNDGCSPLYKASRNGHSDIVMLLMEKNPDVNLSDTDGCSPLIMASQEGHTDIVRLLLEKNGDVDLCDNEGCSPLYKASQKGHVDTVRLLLEKNPDVNEIDKDGCSPLQIARQEGHTDIVVLLLQAILRDHPNENDCCKII